MKNKKLIIGLIGLISAIIVGVVVYSLSNLPSLEEDNRDDFEKLVSYIYESEESLAGYQEVNTMNDGEREVYKKETKFTIERATKVKSEVQIKEKKLSTSGTATYDESYTSYKTIDDKLITEVNGNVFETSYQMPTYYLTFVLSKDFLESDYTLTADDNVIKLNAKVIDNKVSSFFLNKGIDITGLSIEIIVEDEKLKTFNASYISTHGFEVSICTTYFYGTKTTATAIFYLDGGKFKDSRYPLSYIYALDEHQLSTYIVDPNVLETEYSKQIVKPGYHIEGWYQTKTENPDGTVTYSDKWDFEKDKMTKDGVTLYPKWEENRIYTYELYYINENGEHILLDKYQVKEGEKFYDRNLKVKTVEGYTVLGYLNEDLNPWNTNFRHPGGDEDLAVKIYLKLIKGEYKIVTTANEFKSAINANKNIYLAEDIDFKNKKVEFKNTYSGTILGNNHTLSNIVIGFSIKNLKGPLDDLTKSKDHLYISLFFELKNAVIKDVTFDNMSVDATKDLIAIKSVLKHLTIAPLATNAENVTLENVVMNGNFKYQVIDSCETIVITNSYFYKEQNTNITNSSSTFTEEKVN